VRDAHTATERFDYGDTPWAFLPDSLTARLSMICGEKSLSAVCAPHSFIIAGMKNSIGGYEI
jgi:hypothetical protein